jgi:hypothetical protein
MGIIYPEKILRFWILKIGTKNFCNLCAKMDGVVDL